MYRYAVSLARTEDLVDSLCGRVRALSNIAPEVLTMAKKTRITVGEVAIVASWKQAI